MSHVSSFLLEKDTGIGIKCCRGDPNTLGLIAPKGTICLDVTTPAFYQSDDSSISSWVLTGGGGGGGGGGISLSYLGYNTVGASTEAVTNNRQYMQKITVPSDGVLTNIAFYVDDTGSGAMSIGCAVLSDSGGNPSRVLFAASQEANSSFAGSNGVPRWLAMPCGLEVSAGDYWIAFSSSSFGGRNIYYDTGTDHYVDTGGSHFIDPVLGSPVTGSRKYSLRATFLS